jgi:hypothetical protein
MAAVILTSIAMGLFAAFVLPGFANKNYRRLLNRQRPLISVLGMGVASFFIMSFPAILLTFKFNMVATIMLVLSTMVGIGIMMIYSRLPVKIKFTAALLYLMIPVTVTITGVLAGSSSEIMDMVTSRSSNCRELPVWHNPLLLINFISAVFIIWPKKIVPSDSGYITTVAQWIFVTGSAMIITLFYLGGWLIPGQNSSFNLNDTKELLPAVLIFTAKTWLVITAARFVSGALFSERRKEVVKIGILPFQVMTLLGTGAGAVFFEWSQLAAGVKFALQIISTGIFFTLLSLLLFFPLTRLISSK